MTKDMKSEKGFTLIELAIVLIIVGIVATMLIGFMTTILNSAKLRENNTKLEFIQAELNRFLQTRGRFPCPARLDAPIDGVNFGEEVLADCTGGAVAGTFRAVGRNIPETPALDWVRAGAVPTRAMNLPDEYAFDAYGVRFVYAVTEHMANADDYLNNIGTVFMRDLNGNNMTNPVNSAAYVLLSHGPNKSGGFTRDGVRIGGGCAPPITAAEQQNCGYGRLYQASIVSIDEPGNYFDDQVKYYSRHFELDPDLILPVNAVIQFPGNVCPDGWVLHGAVAPVNADHIMCRKS